MKKPFKNYIMEKAQINPAILATVAKLVSYFPFEKKDLVTQNKVANFEKKAIAFLTEKEEKGESALCLELNGSVTMYPVGLWCDTCSLQKSTLPKKTSIMTKFKEKTSVVLPKEDTPQEQLYPLQNATAA